MTKHLRIGDVAKQLHVSTQMVRNYANQSKLAGTTTPGGQRVFTQEQVDSFLGIQQDVAPASYAFYTRSSHGDKRVHASQVEQLTEAYGTPTLTYQDNSSGLNDHRPGMSRMLDAARDGEFTHIAITQKDRLSRFGVPYIERMLNDYGVTLVVLHEKDAKSLQEELMQDFMSLIASFSGKFYRLRGYEQQRKLLHDATERMP